jgi:hypothetical protein
MGDGTITGGCLCGALRYAAKGAPTYMGYCCCNECRKASGSGFIPFMGFAPGAVTFTGKVLMHSLKHSDGRTAERNSCAACGALVFGGEIGNAHGHTLYAGTLDDASLFKPSMAIFLREKADWVVLPPGLTLFEGMPGRSSS